jgi:hypothetical protein
MQIVLQGQMHTSVPIRQFRQQMQLPEHFGVQLFEPKDFSGLAAIDRAGAEMNDLRAALSAFVPPALSISELLPFVDQMVALFRAGLAAINDRIGLGIHEVEFAVSGFADVLHHWAYALIRASAAHSSPPAFEDVYLQWLHASIRLSQRTFSYPYRDGSVWQIQLLNHAYGRFGLRVQADEQVWVVQDGVYACPAEGYMEVLLSELCQKMLDAVPAS